MGDLSKKARDNLLAKIGSQEVVAAFELLVAGLAELGAFELKPNIEGQKKALHFKSGKVSYFAFIANRNWLLWYFRRPGLRDDIFDLAELKSEFPALEFSRRSDPEKVEGMLRIRTVVEASAVLSFVSEKFQRS